jgi:alpha-L-rhamnosidase
VGDDEISNGFTNYNKSVLVATYDVTASLRSSNANYNACFGVILGNGMYNVFKAHDRYTKFVGSFGPRKLFLQLDVEYPKNKK